MNLKTIPRILVIIVGGIVAITVGFFMLRGTMRLWDKSKKSENDSDKDDNEFNKN